ncbi:uncharacterized protein PV09_08237 [Verruconis gallopava]|uniref:Uncharacterized protein n=1 Tax=Verruconis gallopava TaxID=253628 RepID=A0A0D1YH90_9PEZI|nr:uncharacterized protein PV09_08237 [Verruconis gallopava]KIW00197.1 hypothetical protein PV09_08237 [Verruconis gallopava]
MGLLSYTLRHDSYAAHRPLARLVTCSSFLCFSPLPTEQHKTNGQCQMPSNSSLFVPPPPPFLLLKGEVVFEGATTVVGALLLRRESCARQDVRLCSRAQTHTRRHGACAPSFACMSRCHSLTTCTTHHQNDYYCHYEDDHY